jgi:DNA repair protein SbcD/Mre11
MADCHIGSWRDPRLREISTIAFVKTIDDCINKEIDFLLISGDLFNSSIPGIDKLKTVVEKLKELKDNNIPVYIIPGSHDFSPSGKTMLDVLESAGLCINVVKGSINKDNNKLKLQFQNDKSGAKITGMLGKRGMLEKEYFEDLDINHLEAEDGFKIFMLHTALTELKSKDLQNMDSAPLSLLPKGFNYYAAGHVHERINQTIEGYGQIVYPGPIFPNNFKELEDLKYGSYFYYDNGQTKFIPIEIHKVFSIKLKCDTIEEFESELNKIIRENEFKDNIVTMRLTGTLLSGKISEIDFKKIFNDFYEKDAYFVMKNTSALKTKDFEEVKIHEENVEEIESSLINEHVGQIKDIELDLKNEKEITQQLILALNDNKKEGERNIDFEERIINNLDEIIKSI